MPTYKLQSSGSVIRKRKSDTKLIEPGQHALAFQHLINDSLKIDNKKNVLNLKCHLNMWIKKEVVCDVQYAIFYRTAFIDFGAWIINNDAFHIFQKKRHVFVSLMSCIRNLEKYFAIWHKDLLRLIYFSRQSIKDNVLDNYFLRCILSPEFNRRSI